jgi:hypothetical protein
LRHTTEVQTPGVHRPDTVTGRRAGIALGLWIAVLAVGPLAGRRYIDPGSGSFAIQIIIAAVLGGLLTARLWLRHFFWRVVGLVRRTKPEEQPADEEADR